MKLKGKYVVITGASSGIGEQVAYEVAKRGGIPILLARSKEKLAQIAQHVEQTYGIPCLYEQLDVSNQEEVDVVFDRLLASVDIDILVNNAGFGVFRYVEHIDLSEAKQMFDVNVLGLIACTKKVYTHMMKKRSGHIINVASQAGKMATPKSSVYAATKHAVLGFTNSLRMEASMYGIYVTAINPGPIETNFFTVADTSGEYVKNVKRWMLRPEFVAKRIVDVMLTPTREVNLPFWMHIGSRLYQLFPALIEKVGKQAFLKK
ncbi:SDR family oxidoreductase [Anoxybacillus sp. LAT_35]|uniref:SDR family NAD(P)-dependent oxidoreductase n=1 Tax=unclassified Anoxybacillus TaxID=2639704 RepID=UPI001EDC2349|nr:MULTISPECIES: SDR family oxidoreductase [unclassified Anoxybacillus]MCG5024368.1 SDR family oxidoreductase [Anoxybacillus flavithermus]MCG6198385.1 SDR family oxidoreductase [Anoxybacillus sp. LAT_38]MCG3085679.1 SDR family oxidoreductase [Anoxybacillus sp. LAT27]MCG6171997.1 SDR family oxidoreductase [Anoxybacillus sp. LAT_11]MCG6174203.1 SDR family oxidoreductase [Anoxybacillus sp. LAT_31]